MANLELHNPEDTCSFVNASEYNKVLGPIVGSMYEPLSEQEFQQLRAGSSCAVSLVAAEMPEAFNTPPENAMSAQATTGPEPPAKPTSPYNVTPIPPRPPMYPYWMYPLVPQVDARRLKVIVGAAGVLCTLLLGWLIRKER